MQYIVDDYTLEYIESEDKYYISFKDSVQNNCRLEISKSIYDEYILSKKSYKKMENDFSRHTEHSYLTENTLYKRAIEKRKSAEDDYINELDIKMLRKAEKNLTEKQLKRIELHYIEKISIRDLAKLENVGKNKIEKSLYLGMKKFRKFFKN